MDTTNKLKPCLDRLWVRLNVLNGMLFLLETQLNNFRKTLKQALAKQNFPIESLSGGAALVIRDLIEWPDHGWAEHYSSGSFHTRGDEYMGLVDRFVEREAAWTIAQGYEAFESFAFDLLAAFLWAFPQLADASKGRKIESKLKASGLTLNQPEFWRQFVRILYGNSFSTLEIIRSHSPLVAQVEKANNRVLDLTIWHLVAAEVRHAATHSNMVILRNRTEKWTTAHFAMVEKLFGATSTSEGLEVHPNRKSAEHALKLFAEYAYGLFKGLSQVGGYSSDVFPRQIKSSSAQKVL